MNDHEQILESKAKAIQEGAKELQSMQASLDRVRHSDEGDGSGASTPIMLMDARRLLELIFILALFCMATLGEREDTAYRHCPLRNEQEAQGEGKKTQS